MNQPALQSDNINPVEMIGNNQVRSLRIQFLQALDANDDDFPLEFMKDVSKHLGYSQAPRLPYEELLTEIKSALTGLSGSSIQFGEDEQVGFIDHLVSFTERTTELGELMTEVGNESNSFATEMTAYTDHIVKSATSQNQGTPREIQRRARSFGKRFGTYADKLESLNQRYSHILPKIASSGHYVIQYTNPQTDDDWQQIDEFIATLDDVESSISELRKQAVDAGDAMGQLPNLQKEIMRASRKTKLQYEILIANLDDTIELLQKLKASANSLKPI